MTIDLDPEVCTKLERMSSEYNRYIFLLKFCIQNKKFNKISEYFQNAEQLKIKLSLAIHWISKDISKDTSNVFVDFQKGVLVVE